jgi:autonomous glycyl radical cofactor GrcA
VNGYKVGKGKVEGRKEVKERKEEAVEDRVDKVGNFGGLKHREENVEVEEDVLLEEGGGRPKCSFRL